MKIIISHDVDHLYPSDHFFRDLAWPKFYVRSLLQLIKGHINIRVFLSRLVSIFWRNMNEIETVADFDIEHGIPSTFFFGVRCGLGMSYSIKKVTPWLQFLCEKGFDVGVHGIEYKDFDRMKEEHDAFSRVSGLDSFGVRMHYVRFDEETFGRLSSCGYLFDTTQFNKAAVEFIAPYRVGAMWEFPLYIMDGYVWTGNPESDWEQTVKLIKQAEHMGMRYCTILFHDRYFNNALFPDYRAWYMRLIAYIEEHGYQFISYRQAITELEGNA